MSVNTNEKLNKNMIREKLMDIKSLINEIKNTYELIVIKQEGYNYECRLNNLLTKRGMCIDIYYHPRRFVNNKPTLIYVIFLLGRYGNMIDSLLNGVDNESTRLIENSYKEENKKKAFIKKTMDKINGLIYILKDDDDEDEESINRKYETFLNNTFKLEKYYEILDTFSEISKNK